MIGALESPNARNGANLQEPGVPGSRFCPSLPTAEGAQQRHGMHAVRVLEGWRRQVVAGSRAGSRSAWLQCQRQCQCQYQCQMSISMFGEVENKTRWMACVPGVFQIRWRDRSDVSWQPGSLAVAGGARAPSPSPRQAGFAGTDPLNCPPLLLACLACIQPPPGLLDPARSRIPDRQPLIIKQALVPRRARYYCRGVRTEPLLHFHVTSELLVSFTPSRSQLLMIAAGFAPEAAL